MSSRYRSCSVRNGALRKRLELFSDQPLYVSTNAFMSVPMQREFMLYLAFTRQYNDRKKWKENNEVHS